MRILHYFLGFPPYRSGGMTKYSFDLMQVQVERGDEVLALWPGKIRLSSKKIMIRRRDSIKGIENYELINPLPVSFDEGIMDFSAYMQSADINIFIRFLAENTPDVIHIHTLMGLYREFIIAANKLKIRTVFTTHDYFGICPKVTLYKSGKVCDDDKNCFDCVVCNQRAIPLYKIRIMQSPLYRRVKDLLIVKRMRKIHRSKFYESEMILKMNGDTKSLDKQAKRYRKLRAFYIDILSHIDMIHFNSTLSERIYKRYFTPKASRVISITHKDILDHRKNKRTESSNIRLTYLAPLKPFKGFFVIKRALDDLWKSGNRTFELNIFDSVQDQSPYMKVKEGGYQYDELPQIFADTDVLLAPSVWYETFGFTVLEALSYGVPVIISDHVGAKDIIGDNGIVVKAGSVEELRDVINSLSKDRIRQLQANIQNHINVKMMKAFLQENDLLYKL